MGLVGGKVFHFKKAQDMNSLAAEETEEMSFKDFFYF